MNAFANELQIRSPKSETRLRYTSILINYPDVVLLKAPNQITSLTINNCKLTNIVGIENMKQLQYLNLKDNKIVLIEQLQRLTSLKQVLVDNNYIQDLENLTNQNWICQQNTPTDANLQAYLTDTNSSLTLDAFKAQIAPKKSKSDLIYIKMYQQKSLKKMEYEQQINLDQNLDDISDQDLLDNPIGLDQTNEYEQTQIKIEQNTNNKKEYILYIKQLKKNNQVITEELLKSILIQIGQYQYSIEEENNIIWFKVNIVQLQLETIYNIMNNNEDIIYKIIQK
ncbi:Leucine-rich_repeat domain superfamily [Hexamita inflata]|uniref:Leucine-rich repeat domain superfamily n=1 Tax=Hexamita inflata TaxID=28002 RepID=A0AA86RJZ1_9EUKA|nr:Leucine-rich repeat domain superfamily [Hexamita inflata]